MVGNDHSPVTVLGLGNMGSALAGAFLNNGHPTTVWNRSAGRAGSLVTKGASCAATVAAAVAASPLVIVCVLDYHAMHEILDPVDDVLCGRVIVNLSTGTPHDARSAAAWAAERGADYLDGGIMAIPPSIATPQALVLYSGSQSAFEDHGQDLASLGALRYLGTDPGLAPLYDLALLSVMFGMFAGFFHALAMVGTEKVDAVEFTSLVVPWLTAMIPVLPGFAQQVDTGDYTTDVSSLDVSRAGFPKLIRASQDQGISVESLIPVRALLDRAVAAGHGADSLARLVSLMGRPRS